MLKNRNYTMYVNNHATAARILTGEEAVAWYNEKFNSNYTLIPNGRGTTSTFWNVNYTSKEPITVLENGSYYWFATEYDSNCLYCNSPMTRVVYYTTKSYAFGIRVLISLKSETLLEQGIGGTGTVNDSYKIAQM